MIVVPLYAEERFPAGSVVFARKDPPPLHPDCLPAQQPSCGTLGLRDPAGLKSARAGGRMVGFGGGRHFREKPLIHFAHAYSEV